MSTWARGNLRLALIALLVAATHIVIRRFQPAFCPPYPGKLLWIRVALQAELGLDIVFLGLILTAMKRAFPPIDQPVVDPVVLSLLHDGGAQRRGEVKWRRVFLLITEGLVYAGVWMAVWSNRI